MRALADIVAVIVNAALVVAMLAFFAFFIGLMFVFAGIILGIGLVIAIVVGVLELCGVDAIGWLDRKF